VRRRFVLVSLAVTSLVVIAFTVPLALLVRHQAETRARVAAERDIQQVGSLVALALAQVDELDVDSLGDLLGPLPSGVSVILPNGALIGSALPSEVTRLAAAEQRSVADEVEGGWQVALPVVTREGPIVVTAFVTDARLRSGVATAWAFLAVLGIGMIAAAVIVADRLGTSIVRPVTRLADAARRLGAGDLQVRVPLEGPLEIEEVARSFNWLARRLEDLLAAERESVADLSHRLRTPLTALRLRVERLEDSDERDSLLAQLDRLQRQVDLLIEEARRRPDGGPSSCDLASVVRDRIGFWAVAAEDQDRELVVEVTDEPTAVPLPPGDVAAAVDALVGNVFAHTPPGTGFTVRVENTGDGAVLEVVDEGPGFPEGVDPLRRGESGAGSTGLGLDIVARTAAHTGGRVDAKNRPEGGAVLRVVFGRG